MIQITRIFVNTEKLTETESQIIDLGEVYTYTPPKDYTTFYSEEFVDRLRERLTEAENGLYQSRNEINRLNKIIDKLIK